MERHHNFLFRNHICIIKFAILYSYIIILIYQRLICRQKFFIFHQPFDSFNRNIRGMRNINIFREYFY